MKYPSLLLRAFIALSNVECQYLLTRHHEMQNLTGSPEPIYNTQFDFDQAVLRPKGNADTRVCTRLGQRIIPF